ncbi:MAG: tetratricopeptide repeat protein [Deltaproteobacteria bacterium]|nr:tetratricopeptide repeat protein [Deltaproteobacteria bacterium]
MSPGTLRKTSSSMIVAIKQTYTFLQEKKWPPLFAIILVTFGIHCSAINNEFYWDDHAQVLDAKLTDSWNNIYTIFTSEVWRNVEHEERLNHATIDTFRPMFNLSLLVDSQLFGKSSYWHHSVNLFIHLLSIIFVYLIGTQIFSHRMALWMSAFFSLHPGTVTCIHYVSARPDSMATLFALIAIWISLLPSNYFIRNQLLAAFFLFLALLSKETTLFVTVWIIVVRISFFRPPKRSSLLFQVLIFMVTISFYFALRFNALQGIKAVENTNHLIEVIVNYPWVLVEGLKVAIFHTSPLPLRSFNALHSAISIPQIIITSTIYISLGMFIIWGLIKRNNYVLSATWFILLLAPPTVAIVRTHIIDGHYFYAPTFGIALLYATIANSLANSQIRQWIVTAFAVTICLTAGTLSYISAQNFKTEILFYKGIISTDFYSEIAPFNLGNAYLRQGLNKKAVDAFQLALRPELDQPELYNNLSLAYLRMNMLQKAEHFAIAAVQSKPENARYYYNLGLIRMKQKNWKSALTLLQESLELDPSYKSSKELVTQFCQSRESIPFYTICKKMLTTN